MAKLIRDIYLSREVSRGEKAVLLLLFMLAIFPICFGVFSIVYYFTHG